MSYGFRSESLVNLRQPARSYAPEQWDYREADATTCASGAHRQGLHAHCPHGADPHKQAIAQVCVCVGGSVGNKQNGWRQSSGEATFIFTLLVLPLAELACDPVTARHSKCWL